MDLFDLTDYEAPKEPLEQSSKTKDENKNLQSEISQENSLSANKAKKIAKKKVLKEAKAKIFVPEKKQEEPISSDVSFFGKNAQNAVDTISKCYAENRLHHAVMFYGENFEALETCAKTLSKIILGKNDLENCPDFFTLKPEGKARIIKVGSDSEKIGGAWPENSMRRLISDLSLSSTLSGAKVSIIYEPECFNPNAANAFLKTLEEPPRQTIFFLISKRPYMMLPTILSRCLSLKIVSKSDDLTDVSLQNWVNNYQFWINNLISQKMTKELVADVVMQSYGLLSSFSSLLDNFTTVKFKTIDTQNLDDAKQDALKVGIRRQIRKSLLEKMQVCTYQICLERKIDDALVCKLANISKVFEKMQVFLTLNYNELSSLEVFFLSSMRIWASK